MTRPASRAVPNRVHDTPGFPGVSLSLCRESVAANGGGSAAGRMDAARGIGVESAVGLCRSEARTEPPSLSQPRRPKHDLGSGQLEPVGGMMAAP